MTSGRGAHAAPAPFGFHDAAEAFSPSPGFHLDADLAPDDAAVAPGSGAATVPKPPPRKTLASDRLLDRRTVLLTGGVLVAIPVVGYFAWWRSVERTGFNFANERWFQRDTYAGGADKVSHVVLGYMGTKALQSVYRSLGKTPQQARVLAFGAATLAGALVEIGDGFSQYGYSWEDITANAFGAGAATLIDAYHLDDTVGFRFGYVKTLIPDPCCRYGGYGDDYSKEIYSADLKLAGFLPRIGVKRPGPLRFLLLSLTYGSKGYRYSPAEVRERNVGIEMGLHLAEVLRAVGVKDATWWGKPLLILATYFRFPYTSFGFHYDMNRGRWTGIDTGDKFDPGSIFYD